MFPTLIKIGPFALRSYGLMVAIGFFAAMQYIIYRARAKNIPENRITDLVLYVIVAGLLGARAVYVLTNMGFYAQNPMEIFRIWEGGLVFYGGLIAGAATVIIFAKAKELDLWVLGDIMVPALSLGHFFGRIGCFLAGCCYGKQAALPWAVTFSNPDALAPSGVCLHPTQLYEAAANLAIFAALDRYNKKGHAKGMAVAVYAVSYGLMRFVMEFFRGDDRGAQILFLSQGQALSLILMAAGALAYVRFLKSGRAEQGK